LDPIKGSTQGGSYTFQITGWWDRERTLHESTPTLHELEHDAIQYRGHIVWADGGESHYLGYSHIGWLPDELEVQVDNAAGYYEEFAKLPE
jgi:hypothetical protein